MKRRFVALLLAGAGILGSISAARAANCGNLAGDRIVLVADSNDPDVFLWDSRVGLIDYESGRSHDAKWVLAHTVLARAGTPAFVVACFPGVVYEKIGSRQLDAIGVKITAGDYRGRYGWVASSDMERIRASAR
ncbi:MAG: hypothetical protein ACREM8_13715 [Vulcanimicrobiaceae bacterium]